MGRGASDLTLEIQMSSKRPIGACSISCSDLGNIGQRDFSESSTLKVSQEQRCSSNCTINNLEDMPRARALLLGRLGNHEAALQIYVNRLESYADAEE